MIQDLFLNKEYNKVDLEGDLDPEGEKLICKYAKEKLNSEFISKGQKKINTIRLNYKI